jgi:O-antigen ligase
LLSDSFQDRMTPEGFSTLGVVVPQPDAEAREEVPAAWRVRAAGGLLVAGAFAVVLASVPSVVFDLERYLVPKALALYLTALGLLALGFPSLRAPRWGVSEWLAIAFVVWSAASGAFALNRWLALEAWGIGLSSIVLLLATRELARHHPWPLLAGVLAAAVLGAALGVAQAYGVDWEWLADARPPGATFGNRNFLAHLSVLAVPPLAVTVVGIRRRRWLAPALLGIAILAAAVILTRSRAAWLGGIGGVASAGLTLLLVRRTQRPPRARMTAVLLALALATAAAVFVPNRLDWTTDSPYAETLSRLADYSGGSGRGRLIQYGNSLQLVRENPLLGVGPGNWLVHYPRVTSDGDPSFARHQLIPTNPWPSSDWVAFLTERGLLGALFLLAAGAVGASRAYTRARRGEPEDSLAAAALVGMLAAALIAGTFDAVLLLAAPSYLVWATLGLLLPEPRRAVPWSPASGARKLLRRSTGLLLLIVAAEAASHTAAIAATAQSRNRQTLGRAARLAPGEHRLQLLLAEQGDCRAAARARDLMPHPSRAQELARRCG